jgi:hypothetical protein
MSFLRSLAVFIISLIFVSTILMAITAYSIGNLIQKESMKDFIKVESMQFIDQQCQENCNQYTEYKEACIQLCIADLTNQTQTGVDKAVDEIYQKQIFNTNLEEISFLLSQYILFAVIGIFSGILLLIASKTPLLTLGKDFISIAISLFISSFTPQFMMASVNLPFNLGEAIKDYFSPSFNQLMNYGIIFLIIGIILIIINYLLKKRKKTKK